MKKNRFEEMNELQKHAAIIIGGFLFFLFLAVSSEVIEIPSTIVFFILALISAVIVIGGIWRIVNIVRTPTEEDPDPSPAPAVQIQHVDDEQNHEQKTVVIVQQPSAVVKKTQGRVWGTLGMLYMAAYALYINSVFSSAEVNNIGEALGKSAAINIFSPFFYFVLGAALLALVGVVGKNKICILLSLAATIGAIFILPGALEMLIIPTVMFLISYIRMAK